MKKIEMIKARRDHNGRFGLIEKGKEYPEDADNVQRALEEYPALFGRKTASKASEQVETASAEGGAETR